MARLVLGKAGNVGPDASTYRIGARVRDLREHPLGTGHRDAMRQPRHKKVKPHRAKPSNKGLSPEVRETIIKALPGIIKAVADLIDALKPH